MVTDGMTRVPAAVSTATEPEPALSIQMAGPTETPQGLMSVGSVTAAGTEPSETMLVCTYELVVCASAVTESMTEQTARNAERTTGLWPDLELACTVELDVCAFSAKAMLPDIWLLLMRPDLGERTCC